MGAELLSDRTAQTVEQVPDVSNPAAGDQQLFQEAQQYTEQLAFLPEEEMDCRMTTPEQWEAAAAQEEESQTIPPHLLIYPGSRKEKWLYYRKQIDRCQRYLEEVAAFNHTIRNFINFILSKLEHNSSENYATALYQFYHDERLVEKLIANPISLEHSFYQKYDHCVVSYVPRALRMGSLPSARSIPPTVCRCC